MTNIPMVGDSEQPGWPHNGQAAQTVKPRDDRSLRTIDEDPERLEHGYRTEDAKNAAVAVLQWFRGTLALHGFEFYRQGELRKGDLVIRTGYSGGEGEVEVKQVQRRDDGVEMGTRTVEDGLLRLTATTRGHDHGPDAKIEPGTKTAMRQAIQVFLNEKAGLDL